MLPLGLLFVVAAVLAGAAIGWGAIPGSDGRISGCYDFEGTGIGKARIIDAEAGAACKASERPVDWYSAAGSDSRYLRAETYVSRSTSTGFGADCGPNGTCSLSADCEAFGKQRLIAGGYENVDRGTHVTRSMPELNPANQSATDSWLVTWRNNATVDTVTVVILCSRTVIP